MKQLYLTIVILFTITFSKGQIFSDNFDEDIPDQFLDESQFQVAQNGSDLIISSQGHDEFVNVRYTLNDVVEASTIAFDSDDTIFVRARAEFTSDIRPVLNVGIFDENGISPNNIAFNNNSNFTLSTEWQTFKFVAEDFTMQFGAPDDPNLGMMADNENIAGFTFGFNTGFASFPILNEDGIIINEPFVGTVFIDFVSVGGETIMTNGLIFSDNFDEDIPDQFLDESQFQVSQNGSSLAINSQGHDEFVNVEYTLNNNIEENTISFTSTDTIFVRARAEFTSDLRPVLNVGIFDENGIVPNNITFNNNNNFTLSTEWQTFKFVAEDFTMQFGFPNDPNLGMIADNENIAGFTFGFNTGFASFPILNEDGIIVNEPFVGTVFIDFVSVGEEIDAGESIITIISEKKENLILNSYPNPVVNTLFITNNELNAGNYMISNSQGIVVSEGIITQNEISVEDLSTGSYIVTATSREGVLYTTQFIKD